MGGITNHVVYTHIISLLKSGHESFNFETHQPPSIFGKRSEDLQYLPQKILLQINAITHVMHRAWHLLRNPLPGPRCQMASYHMWALDRKDSSGSLLESDLFPKGGPKELLVTSGETPGSPHAPPNHPFPSELRYQPRSPRPFCPLTSVRLQKEHCIIHSFLPQLL